MTKTWEDGVLPFSRFLTKTAAITSLLYGFSERRVARHARSPKASLAGLTRRSCGPEQLEVTPTTFAATTSQLGEAIECQPQVGRRSWARETENEIIGAPDAILCWVSI
jgi:hypothetical protein